MSADTGIGMNELLENVSVEHQLAGNQICALLSR